MPKQRFEQIAARMFNTPLMVEPDKASIMVQALGSRLMGGGELEIHINNHDAKSEPAWSPSPLASLLGDELGRGIKANPRRGYSTINGVAIIPVTGTLVHRGAHIGESSGVTSYEGLRAQFLAAAEDPEVSAIAMEVDSYGGEVAGCFELCDRIREVRAKKPIYAFLAENACSAGYAIACQASHITIPEFGRAGSIGVVTMHVDYSKNLAANGVKVTFVHSGKHKVEGNPYEPISEETLASMQSEIDKMRAAFAMQVSEGRKGRVSASAAIATEARVYLGADAVTAGLVDEVAQPKAAFDALIERVSSATQSAFASGGPISSAATAGLLVGEVGAEMIIPIGALMGAEIQKLPNGDSGRINRVDVTQAIKEAIMPDKKKAPDANKATTTVDAVAETASVDAVKVERERAATITRKVEKAGLPASLAQEMISAGISLEMAYDRIIDAKAAAANDGGVIGNQAPSASVVADASDRMREGMISALSMRVGLDGGEQNEFTGLSLREMARETLNVRGIAIPRGGAMAMATMALSPSMAGGMHTASDFGAILENIANRSMLKGFNEAEESFEQFTSVGSLTDFRAAKRVGLDMFPSLSKVEDGAEFKYGTVGDHGESIVLATYGKLFAITRQTIINDDLDAFSKIPMKMGRAARRTIGDLVFAIINGNPDMADAVALFHADHSNLAGAGAAPSEATINAAITAMSTQKDRSKNASALNIAPKYILGSPANRAGILQSLNSEYAPDNTSKSGTAKQSNAYNTVHKSAEPIIDARVSGNSWFMLADPQRFDTIEVAYLDGVTAPYLEQQTGWGVDGTEFKVRIDAGVAPLAWEGMYKNPGQ